MKFIASLLLSVAIGFGVLPAITFAIEPNEPQFDQFLKEIGWDKQEYINYLEKKEWYLDDFESVDELGTPLTEESVQAVLNKFQLSRAELNALLVENGDIEEGQDVLDGTFLIFSEELHFFVDFYLNGTEEFEGMPSEEEMADLFTEVGLTEKELEKLFAHFETLNVEDPAFSEKLLELSERMMAFEEFETAQDLTAEQMAEMLDIFSSMLDLFQVEAKFHIVENGKTQAVSLSALMTLDSSNKFDLLVELYNKQGEFLADVLLTADMFGSELLQETGADFEQVEQAIVEPEKKAAPLVKTVKGGKLPTTASDYAEHALTGFALLLAGVFLFRRLCIKGN